MAPHRPLRSHTRPHGRSRSARRGRPVHAGDMPAWSSRAVHRQARFSTPDRGRLRSWAVPRAGDRSPPGARADVVIRREEGRHASAPDALGGGRRGGTPPAHPTDSGARELGGAGRPEPLAGGRLSTTRLFDRYLDPGDPPDSRQAARPVVSVVQSRLRAQSPGSQRVKHGQHLLAHRQFWCISVGPLFGIDWRRQGGDRVVSSTLQPWAPRATVCGRLWSPHHRCPSPSAPRRPARHAAGAGRNPRGRSLGA
jgi:hypothetical protein